MTPFHVKLWINGKSTGGPSKLSIKSPFSGEIVSEAEQASAAQAEEALQASKVAFEKFRKTSRYLRSQLLAVMAKEIELRRAEFVQRIVLEAGKPFTLADAEVSRAVGTFTIAAEEARRYGGSLLPVDWDASAQNFSPAVSLWLPRGPVLGISPFNFPLNLVAHKVAPALAIGTSILLKPPPQAPGAAFLLACVFESAVREVAKVGEIPLSAFQVIHASNDVMSKAVEDERISILSFTGSDKVGWMLRDRAKKKKVLLELGGNAAVIVHSDADLARAAQRSALGGYAYAGQICISIQRILVQTSIANAFEKMLTAEIEKLPVGDPQKKETVVGPIIDSLNVDRILNWVDEAKKSGAKILLNGKRDGNILSPILLANVPANAKVSCEEIFGPVVILETYENFEEALQKVNASPFGLQAGIFTDSQKNIQRAVDELDVGGILINEIPTYRADHLPYGGTKNSGMGREGLIYAMEEYSERKTAIQWRAI
jgi:acyl-CoA reductase-like NAD-dependent aldehyde dehydrogenase